MAQIQKPPQWLKADELKDIEKPIEFKILTEAKSNEGNYGTETICEVYVIVDGQKERAKWRINDKSLINIIDSFGADSSEWIGKQFSVIIDKSGSKASIVAQPQKQ